VIQRLPKSIVIDGLSAATKAVYTPTAGTISSDTVCPSCDNSFPKVSGLLQHIETAACGAGYNGILEKLRRYIKQQVQNVLE
jgi:hypothetical protein